MNNNIEKKKRQKELTEKLNAASRAYYQEAREILGIKRNCLKDG